MRTSKSRRWWELTIRPGEVWSDIAADSSDPAELLLPVPALLVAIAPVCFLIGHGLIGVDGRHVSLGRGLGWAAVYYALVVGCLLGEAFLLKRIGPALGSHTSFEDALKLSVYSATPFLFSGVMWIFPVAEWESAVLVAGMLGALYGGRLLYTGLGVLVRSDSGRRALLAVAGQGGFVVGWILGFLLLKKIVF